MPATVEAAVLHKLEKQPRQGDAVITERDAELALTPKVIELVQSIDTLYSQRANKGYGRFQADEITYPAAGLLRNMYADQADFIGTSRQLLQLLAQRANAQPLSRGGYVLMAQLQGDAGVRWFLVAMLTNVSGAAIDDATLEVSDGAHVDVDNLRVAGRVNVNAWLTPEDTTRYIGFLKQQGDVAEYFKSFLGCDDVVQPKRETTTLLGALKNFAATQQMDVAQEEQFLRVAYNFCDEVFKARSTLSLEALANAVWPNAPQQLRETFADERIALSDNFALDRRTLNRFVRIRAKNANWVLDMKRQALLTGDAVYDPVHRTLILQNLPADLVDELNREVAGGDD